jgi:hypothetical protein
LEKVGEATKGNTASMAQLVGDVGGLTAALALTGPQAQRFKEILVEMGNATGATDAAFAKMADSLDVSTAKVANSFKILLVNFGQPLLDEFGGIANAIAKIFTAIGDSAKGGALEGLVKYIEGVLGEIEKAIETVAKNLPDALENVDFSAFTKGIEAVGDAFGVLFDGIDLTTVEGLTAAIDIAGVAFLGLSKFAAGVIESFKPLFDQLVKVGEGATKIDGDFFKLIGNVAGAAAQINLLAGSLNNLTVWLEALIGVLTLRGGIGVLGALLSLAPAGAAAAAGLGGIVVAGGAVAAVIGAGAFALNEMERRMLAYAIAARQQEEATRDSSIRLGEYKIRLDDIQQPLAGMSGQILQSGRDLALFGDTVRSVPLEDLTVKVGNAAIRLDSLRQPLEGLSDQLLKTGDSSIKFAETVEKSAVTTEKFKVVTGGVSATIEEVSGKLYDNGVVINGISSKTESYIDVNKKLADGQKNIVAIIDASTGKIIGYEQATGKATATTDKAAASTSTLSKEQQKAQEATDKLHLELSKLANDKQIALIEAAVKLNVAEIEADTKRIEASFDSINEIIGSTNDLIGDLFGERQFANDWGDLRAIEEQVALENKIKQGQLDLQKALIEAQVNKLNAEAQQVLKGDALIKIDGAGLQPHLEGFMWEILRTIQMRANRDGRALLLGL